MSQPSPSRHAAWPAGAPASDHADREAELRLVLEMLRLQLQSYERPDRDGWMRALRAAGIVWGAERGARVFADLAWTLDAMRQARRSPFCYSNPDCPNCARRVTPHEGLFLQVLRFLLGDAAGKAADTAFLLCEANPCPDFLAMAHVFATTLAASDPAGAR